VRRSDENVKDGCPVRSIRRTRKVRGLLISLVDAKLENTDVKQGITLSTMLKESQSQDFMQAGAARAAALLRAVGNEHRLLVLCLLIEWGELPVGALLERLPLSQSALSQHLARMRDEGLVVYRRESQTLYYRIANPDVERLIATLKQIFCP
jgi:DNA-binding transcriptional ArsR family regulator